MFVNLLQLIVRINRDLVTRRSVNMIGKKEDILECIPMRV